MYKFDPERITYLAATDARGKHIAFGIRAKDRTKHVYIIGKTGMGKSTLLENMAIQDIQSGEGICFIDPHGASAEKLLDFVPKERIGDVVYLAPFDLERPLGFNVMEDVGYDRRHLVVSGLLSAFKRIWVDAWSARMEYILQNTLLALLEYPNTTLLDVNKMLSNADFRGMVVDRITDPIVKRFWKEEFAQYTDRYTQEATPAIQNKIGQFTANPLIRNIIGQTHSTFSFREIMDNRKIIIINLSKGRIGEQNADLLGSILTTKLYLAALSRAEETEGALEKLPPFYFYVDEFQSIANDSFANILSEARKYKLCLTIAHQYVEQVEENIRSAVFGNVGTTIAFRIGPFDAETLETVFSPAFSSEDLVGLGFAQVYVTLMIDGVGSSPFSAVTLPPVALPPLSYTEKIIKNSRERYGVLRAQIEESIRDGAKYNEAKTFASAKNKKKVLLLEPPEQSTEGISKNINTEADKGIVNEYEKYDTIYQVKSENKTEELALSFPVAVPKQEKPTQNTISNPRNIFSEKRAVRNSLKDALKEVIEKEKISRADKFVKAQKQEKEISEKVLRDILETDEPIDKESAVEDVSSAVAKSALVLGIFLVCSFPVLANAGIFLSEIMYNPIGSDTGHEWVEICNAGSGSEDAGALKFFEEGVSHTLTLQNGVASLGANECAVIADNASFFKIDNVGFVGNLFDSSFSLKNDGETIALRNSGGVEIDSIAYSNLSGADEDGKSLHRQNGTLVALSPTHGVEAGFVAPTSASESSSVNSSTSINTEQSSQAVQYKFETVKIEPPQDIFLRIEGGQNMAVGSVAELRAEVSNSKGTVENNAQVYWAFGDGRSATGKSVVHTYEEAGEYVVKARATLDSLSDEKKIIVKVFLANIKINFPEVGKIIIENQSGYDVDLSGWRVVAGYETFFIPNGTIVLNNGFLPLTKKTMEFSYFAKETTAQIIDSAGTLVASAVFEEKTPESKSVSIDLQGDSLPKVVETKNDAGVIVKKSVSQKKVVKKKDPPIFTGSVGAIAPKEISAVSSLVAQEVSSEAVNETETTFAPKQVAGVGFSIGNLLPDSNEWSSPFFLILLLGVFSVVALAFAKSPSDEYTIVE